MAQHQLVVAGITLLTVIWVPVGFFYFVVAWVLVVVIVACAYTQASAGADSENVQR